MAIVVVAFFKSMNWLHMRFSVQNSNFLKATCPMEDFSDTGSFVHSSIASGLVGFISILAMVLVVCCRISYLLYIRTESQKNHVFPSAVYLYCLPIYDIYLYVNWFA